MSARERGVVMPYQVQVRRKGSSTFANNFQLYYQLTPKVGDEIECSLDDEPIRARVTKVASGQRMPDGEVLDRVTVDEIGPAPRPNPIAAAMRDVKK
jgi:hypothetical protein